jgi:rSAM/selenodomain-associated transferase 1
LSAPRGPAAVLALFAKQPLPGFVKTRLCPPLEPAQAAQLYTAMLLDILEQHAAEPGVERVLWYTPAEGRPWFERNCPAGYQLRVQRGAALAERMRELFRAHAAEGHRRIVLRGTDSPTLPPQRVTEAFAALARVDLVLCPDRDGGYNLIGLREPQDALFELQMSTGSVLEGTLARAREKGLRVQLLEPHHDVDTAADLALLESEMMGARAPRTAAWLAETRARMPA